MFKEPMMPDLKPKEEESNKVEMQTENNEASPEEAIERSEKREKAKKMALQIKGTFDALADKTILDKYYNDRNSLHNYIYNAASWAKIFSEEKPFKCDIGESNEILTDMASIVEQVITNSETGGVDYESRTLNGLLEALDILNGKLNTIVIEYVEDGGMEK
ncbi:MAG: hypothetical protein ACD_11C00121G0002 [uncultured bacterium]|nr:MAG: hypothetical protein ACD_11C00121G0002 [uncultured bacterium]